MNVVCGGRTSPPLLQICHVVSPNSSFCITSFLLFDRLDGGILVWSAHSKHSKLKYHLSIYDKTKWYESVTSPASLKREMTESPR